MKKLIFILVTGVVFCSCNELEVNQEISVKQSEASETQRIALNLEKDSIVHGKDGTILIFPHNCLNQDTGIVIVKLQEYYNLSDMLLGCLTTTSEQRILETDGMINVTVETETGKDVCLSIGKCFKIQMPKTKEGMSLFYGNKKSDKIDWTISETNTKSSADSIPNYFKYGTFNYFESTKLGWINADKFLDFKEKSNLIVSLPESQSGASCYLVLTKYNSIVSGTTTKGNVTFKGMPANAKATLISLGANEQFEFLSMKDVNTNDKLVQLSILQPMSNKEIKSKLENKFDKNLKPTNNNE
jgi:hypothetical protein